MIFHHLATTAIECWSLVKLILLNHSFKMLKLKIVLLIINLRSGVDQLVSALFVKKMSSLEVLSSFLAPQNLRFINACSQSQLIIW